MKRQLTLLGVRYADGRTGCAACVLLTDRQARTLARLYRRWEDGADGNLFRQAATSFADIGARKLGVARYGEICY